MPADAVKHTPLACCPFCGSGEDELIIFCDPEEGRDNSGPSRRIQCAVCHIEAPFYPTEAEAIAAWNRRAPDPIREKLVEALDWTVAEIEGRTRYHPEFYTGKEQRENSLGKAREALLLAKGEKDHA